MGNTLLSRSMVVMGGGGMGGTGGMDGMSDGAGGNFITNYLETLPPWASALVYTLAILLAAWIVGIILGKAYASIRFPDPEKHSVLSPKMKAVFLALIVVVSLVLYRSIAKQDEPAAGPDGGIPSMGEPDPNSPADSLDGIAGGEDGVLEGETGISDGEDGVPEGETGISEGEADAAQGEDGGEGAPAESTSPDGAAPAQAEPAPASSEEAGANPAT